MLEIAYATPNNFTGRPIYTQTACFLHPQAAENLKHAIQLARPLGYKFKVFDAFRPQEAQEKLWEFLPDPTYIANPKKGSSHTRGIALDLTLVHAETSEELEMGTPFDSFEVISHHCSQEISVQAQHNRFLLAGIMAAAGFELFSNEWWHYQLPNSSQYPLLSDSLLGDKGLLFVPPQKRVSGEV